MEMNKSIGYTSSLEGRDISSLRPRIFQIDLKGTQGGKIYKRMFGILFFIMIRKNLHHFTRMLFINTHSNGGGNESELQIFKEPLFEIRSSL